jgi:hypothetical protein
MKTNQTTSAFSRMTRISAAGILIAFSGTAVALADDAPARGSADGDAPTRVIRASATRARAASPAKAELTDAALTKGEAEKPAVVVEPTLPEGEALESFYASVPLLLRRMHPNLRAMSDADILRLVQKRAAEINAEKMGVDLPDAPQAGSGPGGRVFSMNDTDSRAGDRTRLDPGPGNWWNNPNTPKMGEGYRADYSPVYRAEHEMNLQRLRLRSMFGGYADYSNLAFADIIADIDQGGRWPTLALPSNTQDFDGDGELFDPLPARPIVVYYQFLEADMTDIQWDGGTDNFNQVALRTNDSNDDDVIDIGDEADDTDGIADTWITSPFVNRSVIPPPDPADDDEELAAWLLNSGLGALRWGDERPIFTHPDAEASWRIAQRPLLLGQQRRVRGDLRQRPGAHR